MMKQRDNVRILGLALVLAYASWVPSALANTKPDAKQSANRPLNPIENEKKAVVGMIHVVTALDIHQATNNYFNDKKIMLSGYVIQGLGKASYLFKDNTGTIAVYLPHSMLTLAQSAIDTKSKVAIYGYVDTSTFPYTVDAIDLKLKR